MESKEEPGNFFPFHGESFPPPRANCDLFSHIVIYLRSGFFFVLVSACPRVCVCVCVFLHGLLLPCPLYECLIIAFCGERKKREKKGGSEAFLRCRTLFFHPSTPGAPEAFPAISPRTSHSDVIKRRKRLESGTMVNYFSGKFLKFLFDEVSSFLRSCNLEILQQVSRQFPVPWYFQCSLNNR